MYVHTQYGVVSGFLEFVGNATYLVNGQELLHWFGTVSPIAFLGSTTVSSNVSQKSLRQVSLPTSPAESLTALTTSLSTFIDHLFKEPVKSGQSMDRSPHSTYEWVLVTKRTLFTYYRQATSRI